MNIILRHSLKGSNVSPSLYPSAFFVSQANYNVQFACSLNDRVDESLLLQRKPTFNITLKAFGLLHRAIAQVSIHNVKPSPAQ